MKDKAKVNCLKTTFLAFYYRQKYLLGIEKLVEQADSEVSKFLSLLDVTKTLLNKGNFLFLLES